MQSRLIYIDKRLSVVVRYSGGYGNFAFLFRRQLIWDVSVFKKFLDCLHEGYNSIMAMLL